MTDTLVAKFLNRELSWLEFNARVLAEGMDPENLLFDRLKFLGIVSSNFDEFFMVRVAAAERDFALVSQVRRKAYEILERQNEYFSGTMIPQLEAAGIACVPSQGLTEDQREFIRAFFFKELFPVLTPIAVATDKPVPLLPGLSLYIVASLSTPSQPGVSRYAFIEVPKNFSRLVTLPSQKGYQFMLLEHVIILFASELFQGYEVTSAGLMRVTRAAEMSLDEETEEDFAAVMEEALRQRRLNDIVRLEVSLDPSTLGVVRQALNVPAEKIFTVRTWFDLKGISQLAFQPLFQELRRPAWRPRPRTEFEEPSEIWDVLKKRDVWVHHPYDSFEAVTRFLAAAASDPDVLAIKQTLYRVGHDSAVVSLLAKAAENGKRVAVLVELKARFDEEKNITWARTLENAGVSVIYGVAGLKTHAKTLLVVRREPDGIKRYVHLGTGNYNEKTAQIYSDLGYFTTNEDLAKDLTVFFNMITGYSQPVSLPKLVVAPYHLRRYLKRLITRETIRAKNGEKALIMAKMNSLVDEQVIEALYAASQAGVTIKLHVRGICCLRPQVPGVSENIEVTSTVDMFLEHSRMFYFHNSGEDELYLSSADWMPRNLDRRIETMFPIEDKANKEEIRELLEFYFKDNVKSWRLLPDGSYEKIKQFQEKPFRMQEYLCQKAVEREAQIQKIKTLPEELRPQKPQ